MEKLTRQEVKQLVTKIKAGEGTDKEVGEWVEKIRISTGNPNVVRAIMSSNDIEIVMENLYHFSVICL